MHRSAGASPRDRPPRRPSVPRRRGPPRLPRRPERPGCRRRRGRDAAARGHGPRRHRRTPGERAAGRRGRSRRTRGRAPATAGPATRPRPGPPGRDVRAGPASPACAAAPAGPPRRSAPGPPLRAGRGPQRAPAPPLDDGDRGGCSPARTTTRTALLGAHPVTGRRACSGRCARTRRAVAVVAEGLRAELHDEGDGLFSGVLPLRESRSTGCWCAYDGRRARGRDGRRTASCPRSASSTCT